MKPERWYHKVAAAAAVTAVVVGLLVVAVFLVYVFFTGDVGPAPSEGYCPEFTNC